MSSLHRLRTDLKGHRLRTDLDVFVVPNYAQDYLGVDPAAIQCALETKYPVRSMGDEIQPGVVQWVNGDNESLHYRGNALLRGKIWLQRGKPETEGWRRYYYTGWQWPILPATADVTLCPEMLPLADAYDAWASDLGFSKANHYIVTKYADKLHNIGMHFDKPVDIEPESLITVVKTGEHGRPFAIETLDGKPLFSKVLQPGTAVIMTLEANLQTKHGVPVCEDECGSSGSIVFRTITRTVSMEEAQRQIDLSLRGKEKRKERQFKRKYQSDID
jgi:hypothetical protein